MCGCISNAHLVIPIIMLMTIKSSLLLFIVHLLLFIYAIYREDVGMFGRRVGYRHSMRKLIDLQSKIEGWEVSG